MEEQKNNGKPIGNVHPRSLKFLSFKLYHLIEDRLWLKVIIAMIVGIVVGLILSPASNSYNAEFSANIAEWLALPGTIFIKVIQMVVIPLIFASIIRGIASSESMKQLKKTGLYVGVYFLMTTTIAVIIGMTLAFWIQPGTHVNQAQIMGLIDDTSVAQTSVETPAPKDIPSMISSILPVNIFGSLLHGEMLQIVIFSIIIGIAIVNMGMGESKIILDLLGAIQAVSMTIVKWAMHLAPIAVFGLMAKLVSQFGIDMLLSITYYVFTVLLGLFLLSLIYLLLVFLFARTKPLDFIKNVKDVQLLAFSTSSSAAVMPLTLKTSEEKLSVRPSIAQFVVPIGTTINMDGTAIYQVIATIFLAQLFGINLTIPALLLLVTTIIGASIGSPGTPGIGIAILASIIDSVGIPIAGIALILGVDRILDMSRTAINVTGDLTAATVINRIVPLEKSHDEQIAEQTFREKQRKVTKEDVVVSKTPHPHGV